MEVKTKTITMLSMDSAREAAARLVKNPPHAYNPIHGDFSPTTHPTMQGCVRSTRMNRGLFVDIIDMYDEIIEEDLGLLRDARIFDMVDYSVCVNYMRAVNDLSNLISELGVDGGFDDDRKYFYNPVELSRYMSDVEYTRTMLVNSIRDRKTNEGVGERHFISSHIEKVAITVLVGAATVAALIRLGIVAF